MSKIVCVCIFVSWSVFHKEKEKDEIRKLMQFGGSIQVKFLALL